jgi:hypothetical protein
MAAAAAAAAAAAVAVDSHIGSTPRVFVEIGVREAAVLGGGREDGG